MSYLARYTDTDGKRCALYLARGFACTREELPSEIATLCRNRGNAAGKISFDWIACADVARAYADAESRTLYTLNSDHERIRI